MDATKGESICCDKVRRRLTYIVATVAVACEFSLAAVPLDVTLVFPWQWTKPRAVGAAAAIPLLTPVFRSRMGACWPKLELPLFVSDDSFLFGSSRSVCLHFSS
jgi:hypothetical protein